MSERKTSREFAETGFWSGRTRDTVHVLDRPDYKRGGLIVRVKRLLGTRRSGRAGK
jgi:hypothetical protein